MSVFLIDGNVGKLEVAHDEVKNSSEDIVAIICHPHPLYQGTMHNKVVTTISRAMKTLGIESYRFNYRGVGNSEGQYGDGIGELEDLLSVYDWIKTNTQFKKIILCGFSFGGAIAYKGLSSILETNILVTVAPAVDRFDLTSYPQPRDVKWLVVQGIDDDTVRASSVFDFVLNKVNSDLTLVKKNHVGHFFHGKLTDLKVTIEDFVKPIIK
ncbi:alpha/beta hydrolase [Francisella adeliensis]|uniref:Alpha/beta hydrolase n=1 Tax=Francisella adeliensis TaxID=2007306 RepID=A0A2Z4XZH2_9GAMM|nr:alpha/beta hydrolase [Francisella adeliensis]AXA34261.1 alpha/beta hydrolase [Francisella adeliensis]MBK2084902.1 alpha/beta hydrolase [Francisella adeliensis]MBK2096267.1 alpha/beta hydrolase [Francisella adeliensis]QIW12505.1 alpha/beta hydrolase [Francisella adeliensis]QIW14378.1 alpha/beta hydrolase [Francisella adeliensis]